MAVIKQFIVTNYKQGETRLNSNRNFKKQQIDQKDYYVSTKYIRFIKFSVQFKDYEPEKICLIFEKRGKHSLRISKNFKGK